ncbi:MAG: hypothetical protein JW889_03905 [Verrucomicrobia bacterium]|nr:hypothetical protein [Verrucomicrobiota bacterium]
MRKLLWLPVLLIAALVAAPALAIAIPQPPANSFDKDSPVARFPDLDQNRDYTGDANPEVTWCAPTAAANSVWYFGNAGYPELIPNVGGNVANADALISTLGGFMGTADPNGTTIANCVNGLQAYFNANTTTPFVVSYVNAWTFLDVTGAPSAQNLWNFMTNELFNCEDVLPIIWLPGAGGYQGPPVDDSQVDFTQLDSVGGHLVTMTAYNIAPYPGTITIHDPDDAALGTGHFFPAVPAASKITWNLTIVGGAPQGTALAINGGAGGWIVGAIVASPVPEPSLLLLLAPGLGLLALRLRKGK